MSRTSRTTHTTPAQLPCPLALEPPFTINRSPSLPAEAVERVLYVGEVLLYFLPLVEDGAVAVAAQDVVVHGPLAPLAFSPQPREGLLRLAHLKGKKGTRAWQEVSREGRE